MSHFTVLVIGDDVEAALAPYHEFECTGTDDKYIQTLDITKDIVNDFESEMKGRDEAGEDRCTFEAWLEKQDMPVFGLHTDIDPDQAKYHFGTYANGVFHAYRRTNPNKKWDWWQVGGRWPNRLLLKDGTRTDSARKGDVDVEAISKGAAAAAGDLYDTIAAVSGGLHDFKTWQQTRAEHEDIEDARKAYREQRAIKLLRSDSRTDNPFLEIDQFAVSREAYCQAAADGALPTFALIHNGEWYERGEMGWFGFVSDEKAPSTWNSEFMKLFNELPDDAIVTVVDCHI